MRDRYFSGAHGIVNLQFASVVSPDFFKEARCTQSFDSLSPAALPPITSEPVDLGQPYFTEKNLTS